MLSCRLMRIKNPIQIQQIIQFFFQGAKKIIQLAPIVQRHYMNNVTCPILVCSLSRGVMLNKATDFFTKSPRFPVSQLNHVLPGKHGWKVGYGFYEVNRSRENVAIIFFRMYIIFLSRVFTGLNSSKNKESSLHLYD